MNPYTFSPFAYRRFETREVKVGDLGIGGKNPIRVQSMTTSDTRDTESTVRQILDLERAGCELVRLTVPSMADAENLPNIRRRLKEENSKVPLAADIHFTPSAAMLAAEYMEKVRINPGNFADRKKFAVREYTDSEYNEELERISEVFLPFVKKCKELGRAVRIGTNHGSLSDRIMNRFGDTPLGMVESALEFIRIAETVNFHDIIVSMKASNPQVMVHAYRLLVSRFIELGMKYPVHLGVTEAGDGKDGRIKSAMGIGTLLED
ncbi:MAG TPA: (E)-4-hydroxy-3-methylbut-2-enyl-diphosphate synthase, partial [Leptospiraceae bacterium]|nr:(E)-4-hydroxy-3-methylbut-2-enyl-diphosphate synthase [Leptospiraceae bacterium]